jgi:hypothetical protein
MSRMAAPSARPDKGDPNGYYEIKVMRNDEPYHLFFNTKTYLLEYTRFGDLLEKIFNYTKIGKVLIPMSLLAMKGNGLPHFWTRTMNIKFNPEINERIFKVPD